MITAADRQKSLANQLRHIKQFPYNELKELLRKCSSVV